jgi:hypothetical protein
MRLAVAGLGLLGVVGTASVVLWFGLRSLGSELREPRKIEREGFVPVTTDDTAWLGTYRLLSSFNEIELRAEGTYRARIEIPQSPPEDLVDSFPMTDEGKWSREGSSLLLMPTAHMPVQRFELGRLDGGYVLLSEFCTWRQVR